ncbi:hypothetical protein, partial [Vibrio anguillarum]
MNVSANVDISLTPPVAKAAPRSTTFSPDFVATPERKSFNKALNSIAFLSGIALFTSAIRSVRSCGVKNASSKSTNEACDILTISLLKELSAKCPKAFH